MTRRLNTPSPPTEARPSASNLVARAIDAQQNESERLIGWVQLLLVASFMVLFLMSPNLLPVEVWARTAFWALLAYAVFTVGRLYLSYRVRLPGWFLSLSVVADMLLLITLIWSFHLEYQQPAAFYLKAPTLMYVFIFIAIRALRFEARYVVLAGLTAAIGWGALLAYAMFSEGGEMKVTRNYVTYLTSNSILLGAEFDKIISILTVTGILAVALIRGRSILVHGASDGAAAAELSRFFAPEIASQIRQADDHIKAGEGEARQAAILLLDIQGFTRLAQRMSPSETMRLLADYQAAAVPVIQDHGGTIDKFLGDGILATFGAAADSDTYAADALAAATVVVEVMDRFAARVREAGGPEIKVHVAAAAGRVVVGAVGDDSRLEYTVIGDPVNLAAKLEKHTRTIGCRALTTAEMLATARSQGFVPGQPPAALGKSAVEGMDRPVDLVRLL